MLDAPILVGMGILLALVFDFGNGMNDAANAVSTVVATGVLPFRTAVLLSAFFNMIAAFVFSTEVAKTVGSGIVQASSVSVLVVLCGLAASIAWVYAASWKGIPVSASHALIGGLIGSAVAANGLDVLLWQNTAVVFLFIFLAPIVGFACAVLFSALVFRLVSKMAPSSVNSWFKKLQLVSASVYSLGHGTNDAQKTMGIITLLLFSGGMLGTQFAVPFWVVIMSHATIAAGTLAGGRRVVKTLALKITKLRPIHGFCAETAGAASIIGSTLMGIPVSTTHVIAGSIMGVGASQRASAVRWVLARKIIAAWALTIPVAALCGAVAYYAASTL
ncbi:anion permease [Candidatus Micrarchaeota archaeon CG_4_10_14_0_2_um_filter_60_11]|nr:MAG: anion permease [Candidatus Micrarchaeota archaeon CG1_02_60_51]PIN96348.1 MAG: anion permease [Candidatus Micrarchaeota archaeon CG10_big_fil_rev_8_21_14_0_10_60_32]PIO01735.1 MAG: anion permease [Candidatus Micrarchaeota archaeon CG09_land_8_20_14_0_10_60_16]PIY91500.1 MAG: anion permease [Candidatus Micrarchaeota archaeon CG_4_10_14_0_8_um_filter_60_7]PIZ91115.1 MAG: anion permease [Candidatus Micrarchaeota archaeon CG_4_10_14_0_2_um_filter_60_11]